MNPKSLIAGLIGLAACLILPAPAAEDIRLTNGEWPPFTSKEFQHGGVMSRIVTEAFAAEGVTVQYEYVPWKRAYAAAKDGEADGSVGWAPTPDHVKDLHMSDPVISVDKGLFHLKSTPFTWPTIEDLGKWKVGATAGYAYGDEWDKGLREGKFKVEEVGADEQNLKKLLSGRIDVFAMEVDVASHLMQTRLSPAQAATVVCSPKLLMQTPICLALTRRSDKSAALIERFNSGLKKLKADGRYEKYMKESRNGDYFKKKQAPPRLGSALASGPA